MVIPAAWLTPARVHRLCCHWTAGTYKVSSLDKKHYHCILGLEAGQVVPVRGIHSPADNDRTSDGDYAAHVLNLNTNSYGLAAACMAGAKQGVTDGKYPLTEALWEKLAEAAADVVRVYRLAVTQRTVLFHSEVERVYGKKQRGKWDISYLPFDRSLSPAEVYSQFRRKVSWYLKAYPDGRP